jgi:hypothetical protein
MGLLLLCDGRPPVHTLAHTHKPYTRACCDELLGALLAPARGGCASWPCMWRTAACWRNWLDITGGTLAAGNPLSTRTAFRHPSTTRRTYLTALGGPGAAAITSSGHNDPPRTTQPLSTQVHYALLVDKRIPSPAKPPASRV